MKKSRQKHISSKSPKNGRFKQLEKFKKQASEHENKILKIMGFNTESKK
ncbi:MAG: hypothetical protein IPL10_16510 [Bacteroidetes bacterium]|nr:hypothetical protein [Bacteroidota bacterium]